jgi:hypothetical protein
MEISSFATAKVRALLDTYFDPSLLDTQMQKLASAGALIFLSRPQTVRFARAVCFVIKLNGAPT